MGSRVFVIRASLSGIDALSELVAYLPPAFPHGSRLRTDAPRAAVHGATVD